MLGDQGVDQDWYGRRMAEPAEGPGCVRVQLPVVAFQHSHEGLRDLGVPV